MTGPVSAIRLFLWSHTRPRPPVRPQVRVVRPSQRMRCDLSNIVVNGVPVVVDPRSSAGAGAPDPAPAGLHRPRR